MSIEEMYWQKEHLHDEAWKAIRRAERFPTKKEQYMGIAQDLMSDAATLETEIERRERCLCTNRLRLA
jgi:fructose 1,6-bisphosphatase